MSAIVLDTTPRSAPALDMVAVVVPAYRVAPFIGAVLAGIPSFVRRIYVVDDGCPEGSGQAALLVKDSRIEVIRHEHNRGVGAATKTGIERARAAGCGIVVKLDGDGQMDASRIAQLLAPIQSGRAALVKGNRLSAPFGLDAMPLVRRLGNIVLSFLVKGASGYWNVADPTNGFLAIRTDVYASLDKSRLAERFFFEISMLMALGARGYVVADVPTPAIYNGAPSSLSPAMAAFTFPLPLLWGGLRRFALRHFWYDFTATALLCITGLPLVLWGVFFGVHAWLVGMERGEAATAGTVMLAALPFLLGVNLLVHAFVLEAATGFNRRASPWD